MHNTPIGIFDSGYGGLTILKEIEEKLPQYDYLYIGDNARAPYGNRSYDTVYKYTLQMVNEFFKRGCELVILACNTASAKALRTIQQNDLPLLKNDKRVLGIIRPTAEVLGSFSKTGQVGVLATVGTVQSESYILETEKFFPEVTINQLACPMWVPLVENGEHQTDGASYFVQDKLQQLFAKEKNIDTILLACTHYPLLMPLIKKHTPPKVKILSQGGLIANSLVDYLGRHKALEKKCSKNKKRSFFTTDNAQEFEKQAELFLGRKIVCNKIDI
jgi:glutamate racemase